MQGRTIKLGIAGAVMAAGFFYAVISSMRGPGKVVYSYSVTEFIASQGATNGAPSRVSGRVVPGTIQKDIGVSQVRFRLADASGAGEGVLDVVYPRMSIPDAFKDDAEVMVEGTYSVERRLYQARQLFTKCPSKYEAKPTERAAAQAGLPAGTASPGPAEAAAPGPSSPGGPEGTAGQAGGQEAS